MSKGKFPMWIVAVVIAGVLGIVGMVGIFNVISIKNQDVELTNQFDAEIENNKIVYTKVLNIISGKANVAITDRNSFGEIYGNLMDSRAEATGSAAMAWVKEQNPQMTNELFLEVSQAIEVQRSEFARVQRRMVDIKREHDNLRERFPTSIVMGWIGAVELELQLVTSTAVENAFESGVDDDTNPFSN